MIKFESVGKTFRDGTTAVVDLDLLAPSGQITVIVGPSGCGKTTTLRMVNRMLEPTSGRILWDGTPIKSRRKTTLRRQMGYVIQSGGLFPHRTVVDNIGTVPGLLRWDKQKIQKRSMELLGSVGLDTKLAHRYPAQLSGGQQQRVGVARALAADPLVLLMDEPFSAVDPVVRSELHEFFLGLQRELSKTIILITHDIDEAIKLGDRVAILRVGGKLAQAGTPQEVLEEPADAFVEGFVGRDRGYRSLSFLPAGNLHLERVQAVRDPATVSGDEPALVIDSEAKPLGWAAGREPGRTLALGSTFDPEKDTLRTALDSALTSPVGLAVALGANGRYAGVVSAASILQQVTEKRSATAESVAESITVADKPAVEEGAESDQPVEPDQSDEPSEERVTDQPDADVRDQPEETEGETAPPEGISSAESAAVDQDTEADHDQPRPPSGSTVAGEPVAEEPPLEERAATDTPLDADRTPADQASDGAPGGERSEQPPAVLAEPGQPHQPEPEPDRPRR
ncbi:MAG TPA: ATP-binding cassette domain-containing protein [Microlunatus sp.]